MSPAAVLAMVASLASLSQAGKQQQGEKNGGQRLLSAEQVSLVLHIESLLPMALRVQYLASPPPTSTSTSAAASASALTKRTQIKTIHTFRAHVLASVLEGFNAVTASAKNKTEDVDVVEGIIEAFAWLPYVLPDGATTSCPYPALSPKAKGVVGAAAVEAEHRHIVEQVNMHLLWFLSLVDFVFCLRDMSPHPELTCLSLSLSLSFSCLRWWQGWKRLWRPSSRYSPLRWRPHHSKVTE